MSRSVSETAKRMEAIAPNLSSAKIIALYHQLHPLLEAQGTVRLVRPHNPLFPESTTFHIELKTYASDGGADYEAFAVVPEAEMHMRYHPSTVAAGLLNCPLRYNKGLTPEEKLCNICAGCVVADLRPLVPSS